MPAGRPTDYRQRYCKDAKKLCTLGATDKDLADFFEVSESTINLWKETHPEFSESIKQSKADLDKQVERSLCHRAMGYSHPDTHFSACEGVVTETPTTKYYPPSEVACIFWLKNRQPGRWREKQEVEVSGAITLETEVARVIAAGGMPSPSDSNKPPHNES